MKKLTNVSPFILLLFPVFIMMVLAFATNNVSTQEEELVSKTTATTSNMVKATTAILK